MTHETGIGVVITLSSSVRASTSALSVEKSMAASDVISNNEE